MFQTALAITTSSFEKALSSQKSKAPKPKLGYADGMAVLAIGPKGGKIVGWKNGKPIYAGSSQAKTLKKQKQKAKAEKKVTVVEDAHGLQIKAWLDELGIQTKGKLFGVFVVKKEDAKKLEDSFGKLKTLVDGGMVKIKAESLWPHVGEPLKPPADELTAWAAKGAAGADEDPPFPDEVLATLKLKGSLGGSHGGQIVVDDKGNQYAWKTNKGDVWVSRAEEVFNRVAKLVFPNPSLYPDAEMVEHDGKKGVLLSWVENKGTLGNEVSGDHGVPQAKLQKHFERLVQHQVLDWLMANHDSHGANFVETPDGDVAAIDKGQAFKAIGADKLSDSYKLNPSSPAYNAMWKLFQEGKIKGDPVKAVAEMLESIEKNLSLEQYQSIVLPYLEEGAAGLSGFDPKKKWALIKQRYNDLRSNWETFLSEMTGKPVDFSAPPSTTAPAASVVEDEKGEVADVQKLPGWPITKGKVTVFHPGGPVPEGVKWPSKYPGPGYHVKVLVSGKPFEFEFGTANGKMQVHVKYPDGIEKTFKSPASAADSVTLWNKGLDLDMSSTEKKKQGIAFTASKLFALKKFEEELKAAGKGGTVSVASTPVQELDVPAEKTDLTLHEMMSTVEDGIVLDEAMVPAGVQTYAEKHHGAPVDDAFWPSGAPAPGTVMKVLNPGGTFDVFVVGQHEGDPIYKQFIVSSDGTPYEFGLEKPENNEMLKTLLGLPDVKAAADEFKKQLATADPPPPVPVEVTPPPAPAPVPEEPPDHLVWTGPKVPTEQEVAALPAGTLVEDQAGYTYKKETDGSWVTTSGVHFPASEIAESTLKIVSQPGAPGTSGTKPLTVDELAAFPVGTIIDNGVKAYTKIEHADFPEGKWEADGMVYTAPWLDPEQHEWAVNTGTAASKTLAEAGYTYKLTPLDILMAGGPDNIPEGTATPSIAGEKGVKVVTTKETLPDFPQKDLVWSNAEKLAGAPVPNQEGKTFGMKSPKWDGWVPPMGVWIEGEWKGKKAWFTTTSSGYNDDSSTPNNVKFLVVDEDGNHATSPMGTHSKNALAQAFGVLSPTPWNDIANGFNLDKAAFAQDDTFATHKDVPHVDEVVSTHPQDIPPEQKTKAVVATMKLADYIKQESVKQKYGGTFYLSNPPTVEEKYGEGAHYLRFYPDGDPSTAGQVLQQFLDDHNLATHKAAQHWEGDKNAWCVLTEHASVKSDHAVETTVLEAASTAPPIAGPPKFDWPEGASLGKAATLDDAPVGAAVWTSTGDKLVKLPNGNWSGIDASGDPLLPQGLLPDIVAGFTLVEGSGYAGFDPALGDFQTYTASYLKGLPVGAVVHSDQQFGLKLTKENETYWKGSDGKLYGNTAIATGHALVVDYVKATEAATTAVQKKAAKKVKTIGGHLKFNTVLKKVQELPAGVVVHTKFGSTFAKQDDGKFLWKDKLGNVVNDLADYGDVAEQVFDSGGATVQHPGDKVKPKKKPVTLKVVAPTPPVNSELIKKAKEWATWSKEHPKPSDKTDLLMLAFFQKEMADKGLGDLYAHDDGHGGLMLTAKDAEAFKKVVDNWEGFPPYEEKSSPLGTVLVVKKKQLAKTFPDAKYVKGQDGELYPQGTKFTVTQVTTKTVKDVVTSEFVYGFGEDSLGKPKKIKPHDSDSDKLVIKFGGVSPEQQEAAKKYLDDKGITIHGEPMVATNTVFTVSKADLEKAVETKEEVTAQLPDLPPPFVQAGSPFALGPQKQGDLAVNNEGDLGALDAFKLGYWGHTIRHGGPGVWFNSQISVRRVSNPSGEDYYEITGDLMDFDRDNHKLSAATIKYFHPVENGVPSFDIYDPETGLHTKGDKAIEGGWHGYDGQTDNGSYVGVCWKGGSASSKAELALRGRLTARIPVSKDVPSELQHALQMAGLSPELAGSSHDADAERIFIKAQLVRSAMDTKGYWGVKRSNFANEKWLDAQLKKYDYAKYVDTARIKVGAGGAHTVEFDRFSDEDLKDVYFVHTGGASPQAAASLLKSEAGVPSRKQGYTNGTAPYSGQASSDINTGGAAGLMSRVARKNGPGATAVHGYTDSDTKVRYIYHPRVLKRADYWCHHGDEYGSQWQAGKLPETADEKVLSLSTSSHEVLFENGMAYEDIAGVWCRTETIRKELIADLKSSGKKDINGVPLADFFFTGTQSDSSLKDACKGLKVMK